MNIPEIEFKLKANEFKILQYIKVNPEFSSQDAAYDLGVSGRTVLSTVQMLEKLGVIDRELRLGKETKYFVLPQEQWTLQ